MRYNLLRSDGLEIGYITDSPEFRWEINENYRNRRELERAIRRSKNYQMVVAGGALEEDALTPPEEDVPIDDTGRVVRLASELPAEFAIQVERADEMDKDNIAQELTSFVGKGRRYISDPTDAPDDVEVQEGPQGGLYYETQGPSTDADMSDNGGEPFTPANSPEEAIAFAEEHIADEVDFEGMELDAINEVNEALFELTQQEALPGLESVEFVPGGMNVEGASASQAGDSIYLSSAFREKTESDVSDLAEHYQSEKMRSIKGDIDYLNDNIEEMERRAEEEEDPDRRERMLQNAENYREQKEERQEQLLELIRADADRPSATATNGDIIRHEYAHHLYKQFAVNDITNDMIVEAVFRGKAGIAGNFKPYGKEKARAVSQYAASEPGEYLAESFVSYHRGEHNRLEDKVIEFWDTMMEKGPHGDWSDEYERWVK